MGIKEDLKKGVGGSESPILLLGECYGKTVEDLYNEKMGHVEPRDMGDLPDVRRGRELEHIALREVEKLVGDGELITGQQSFYYNNRGMCGHIDGTLSDYVVETKCPRASVYYRTKAQGAPLHYQIQCQHYMFLTGLPSAYLAIFCADSWELTIIEIPRHEGLIDIIKERCRAFWEGIQRGELVTFDSIDDVYPLIGGNAIEWGDGIEAVEVYRYYDTVVKKHETAKILAFNTMIEQWPKDCKKVYGDYGTMTLVQRIVKNKPGKPYLRAKWRNKTNG